MMKMNLNKCIRRVNNMELTDKSDKERAIEKRQAFEAMMDQVGESMGI